MDLIVALLLILALLIGLAAGWLARGAALAEARARAADLDARFRQAIVELADAEARARQAETLREERDAARGERERIAAVAGETQAELRALAARTEAQAVAFEAQKALLGDAREALSAQFGEVGQKLLGEAQRQFLERADAQFRQADEKSGVALKALLAPVSDRLRQYEEGVARVEKERQEAYGNLTGLIGAMRDGQEAVRSEAAKLVNSLRSAPKARGRWGEQQLRNVLETCGLSEHADFMTEVSVADNEGEGRLRPDAIVRVPGGRALVIDAKVSLNAYQDAFAAIDDRERTAGLAAHAQAMKAHVNGLGAKAYWNQFPQAPDYVIMFVPGEHFLSAALEHDPALWDFAFEKRVLLATPTNLIAIARTVAAVWRQERLADDARRIGELGKAMHDRLAVAAGHLRTVGGGLSTAVNNYNKFVSSFESRVLVTAREFRDLNIETGAREIEAVPPIEALARYGETAPFIGGPAEPDALPAPEGAAAATATIRPATWSRDAAE